MYDANGVEIKPKKNNYTPPILFLVLLVLTFVFIAGYDFGKPDKPPSFSGVSGIVPPSGGGIIYTTAPQTDWKEQQEAQERERKQREKLWNNRPYLSEPEDAPPSSIKVGPYTYRVYYTTAEALLTQNALALTQLDSHRIYLNPKRDLRTDLMHELFHCAKDVGTSNGHLIGQYDGEENLIEETAPMVTAILRDNPKLVTWLTAEPRK